MERIETVRATCTIGGANKRWKAQLFYGKPYENPRGQVILSWGKIGAAQQSKTKTFATRSEARKFYNDKIAEKQGKGYVFNDGSFVRPDPPPAAPAPVERVVRPAAVAQATSNLERLRAQLAAMNPDERKRVLSERARKAGLTRRQKLMAQRAALAAQREAERLANAQQAREIVEAQQARDRANWEATNAQRAARAQAAAPRYVAPPPPPPAIPAFEMPFGDEREIILRRKTS